MDSVAFASSHSLCAPPLDANLSRKCDSVPALCSAAVEGAALQSKWGDFRRKRAFRHHRPVCAGHRLLIALYLFQAVGFGQTNASGQQLPGTKTVLISAPLASVAEQVQSKPVGGAQGLPYVDRLIEPTGAETEGIMPDSSAEDLQGQRSVIADYRLDKRIDPTGARAIGQGIDFRYRRETAFYGDLYFDAGLNSTLTGGAPSYGARSGTRFTFLQNNFPLSQGWLMNNGLGLLRSPPNVLVNSSYRFFLPSSQFVGLSSSAGDSVQQMYFFSGKLAVLEGVVTQATREVPGNVAGVGYTRQLSEQFDMSGQAISIAGSQSLPDHQSGSIVLVYRPEPALKYRTQFIRDSRARGGWLIDGDYTSEATHQRFGAFRLDPSLLWGDTQISNDQQGLYWRADSRTLRYATSAGIEWTETNIRDNPFVGGSASIEAYGGAAFRVNRNLSVGGNLNLLDNRPRGSNITGENRYSGSAFASLASDPGLSRFEVSRYQARYGMSRDNYANVYSWNQVWQTSGQVSFSNSVSHARELAQGKYARRSSGGISLRGTEMGELSWDATLVYVRVDSDSGREQNFNANAGLSWRYATNWTASAQLIWNTIENASPLAANLALPFQRDLRFALGLRYEAAGGTPIQALGGRLSQGVGRISGQVFFDENGDGVKQSTEMGAANITLYLNGRIPVKTDGQGRFTFSMVAAGTQTLRVLSETLPLPWADDSEDGHRVEVPVRGEAEIGIPLKRIGY